MSQENSDNLKGLQNKSSHGIKWVAIAEIFIRIFQYSATIVLARILSPQDFGVIALALVFIQFAYVLFDFGLNTALIQKKHVMEEHFSTTFVIYISSAILYTTIVFLLAGLLALFFEAPILKNILRTLTVIFFFFALNAIPVIHLQRKMQFKLYSILQAVSIFFYSIVAIVSVISGFGIWSFVAAIIAEQVSLTILLYIFASWKISFRFNINAFRELIHFGSNVLGTRIMNYINTNSPNFIIGKILGANILGYYNIAYQLVEFPVQRISKNVLRVMFPAFSKLQEDYKNYRELFKKTYYHLLLILMPIFAGITLIAPDLVELFYGKKWLPAVLPLQILCAAGFFKSLWITSTLIFMSLGKPGIEFRINIIFAIFLIPAVILASFFSLSFAAAAVSIITLVFLIIIQYKALKLIQFPIKDFLRIFFLPAGGVIFFTFIYLIINYFEMLNFSLFLNLTFSIALCMMLYCSFIFVFDRQIFNKVKIFVTAK